MTAVQNFTGLAELRTTSVEEKGFFVSETYSKFHFQQRVSTVLAVHQESWKCPKENTVFACVANAYHSNITATDLEPT